MADKTTVAQRLKPHAGRLVASLGLLAIGLVAGLGLAQMPLKASSSLAGGTGQAITTAQVGQAHRGRGAGAEHAAWLAGHPVQVGQAGRGGAAEHAAWLAGHPVQVGR